jgi:hypothetical protein
MGITIVLFSEDKPVSKRKIIQFGKVLRLRFFASVTSLGGVDPNKIYIFYVTSIIGATQNL